MKCYNSKMGYDLMVASIGVARSLMPPITQTPYIYINGQHNAFLQQLLEFDLYSYICDYLKKVMHLYCGSRSIRKF